MEYNKEERLSICLDLIKKLQNFPINNGKIDLYQNVYTCIPILKKIFRNYIENVEHKTDFYSGQLEFVEVNYMLNYKLAISKTIESGIRFSQLHKRSINF